MKKNLTTKIVPLLFAGIMLLCADLFAQIDTTSNTYPANSIMIQYSGRIDFTNPLKPKFSAPGVYIQAKFKGTSCTVRLNDQFVWGTNRNFYEVIIDGTQEFKLEPVKNQSDYPIIWNLPYGIHTVMVVKRTESALGYCEFLGFKFSGTIQSPDPKPTHKLQFIGNSISCGSGNEAVNGSTQIW